MKTYVVFWLYYGIRGNEEGKLRIQAESPDAAAQKFYRYNAPCYRDEDNIGYEILDIEEVIE